MTNLIDYINKTYQITAIPINILSEKRWASDDSLFKPEALEGVAQRIQLSEKRGVIIYSWEEVSSQIKEDIQQFWKEHHCA